MTTEHLAALLKHCHTMRQAIIAANATLAKYERLFYVLPSAMCEDFVKSLDDFERWR